MRAGQVPLTFSVREPERGQGAARNKTPEAGADFGKYSKRPRPEAGEQRARSRESERRPEPSSDRSRDQQSERTKREVKQNRPGSTAGEIAEKFSFWFAFPLSVRPPVRANQREGFKGGEELKNGRN